MRTEPEEITLAEYRRLTSGTHKAKRANIPRAAPDERVGLTPLLVAGWSVESPDCVRYRLYQGARDTGMCATLKEACEKAKELSK